jgi:hypothetical protein
MSFFNKVKKGVKKGANKVNKAAKNAGNKYVEKQEKDIYKMDKLVEGTKKAKKNKKGLKKGIKTVVKDYNMASDAYDSGMNTIHKNVRGVPVVGKSLDEGLYMADYALNPIGQTKNILDTVSGKQSLTDGLKNEYLGEAVYVSDTVKRNTKKKKKPKNSKTIEKDREAGLNPEDVIKQMRKNKFV